MFQPDKLKDLLAPAAPVAPVQDPFSLDALIAWLRTKNGATVYCFQSTGHCLISQYAKDTFGYRKVTCGTSYLSEIGVNGWLTGRDHEIPDAWNDVAVELPRTFGAALSRAIAIKARQL